MAEALTEIRELRAELRKQATVIRELLDELCAENKSNSVRYDALRAEVQQLRSIVCASTQPPPPPAKRPRLNDKLSMYCSYFIQPSNADKAETVDKDAEAAAASVLNPTATALFTLPKLARSDASGIASAAATPNGEANAGTTRGHSNVAQSLLPPSVHVETTSPKKLVTMRMPVLASVPAPESASTGSKSDSPRAEVVVVRTAEPFDWPKPHGGTPLD